ncbi:hypothetical protein AXF42_Ash011086 [Apostasia shenzhenica]|uniref:Uncharacterized protein n=1 Tax=Apostasia shenzhenica TaxID=1088818 RepID=A0A2H9ZR24_9ASPA|nr:hypothetical protein AXF42_Ash011086 [Apostasia shenzhenica]
MADEELPNPPEAYPLYFGISCAFIALQFMSAMAGTNAELSQQQTSSGEMMLRGSFMLLGLLFEKVHRGKEVLMERMKLAEREIREFKKLRTEDAKANEKVISIFASREQSWRAERRQFLLQIQSHLRELDAISDLRKKVVSFEEEAEKRKELEEKLRVAEKETDEVEERRKKTVEDHVIELKRHKTAFTELASKQRQLEAEMVRVLRQAEVAEHELAEVFEQKEEAAVMVEKLTEEFLRLQKENERKEKMVSAMARKAKQDTVEKQRLLQEVKTEKEKKQQAELEAERLKSLLEPMTTKKKKKKNPFEKDSADAKILGETTSELRSSRRFDLRARLMEYLAADSSHKQHKSPPEKISSMDELHNLQDWVCHERKNYTAVLEQKHNSEIEAFAEQLRIRDERLEALQWRLISTELDSKRLESHIEGLDGSLAKLRDENLRLEALVVDRERELKSLNEHPMEDAASEGQIMVKMDIQALGVSFKIKRLKQQIGALENLAGKQSPDRNIEENSKKSELKGMTQAMNMLNKQLKRYQSLEEKTDDLCKRMLESSRTGASRLAEQSRAKEKTEKLEQFLEETFQLQRFMVATGQKLTELKTKIVAGGIAGVEGVEESCGFKMGQFLEVVRSLFKEVQRGLELRIARIIGDIEGTLASDGILRS